MAPRRRSEREFPSTSATVCSLWHGPPARVFQRPFRNTWPVPLSKTGAISRTQIRDVSSRPMLSDPASLRRFFTYVVWADRAQLEAASGLSDEAYVKDHGWSFGSVHRVLLHMLAAQ